MKIGLFLPNATFDLPGTNEVGGIEVYAIDLGEQLVKRGHDVTLFGGRPKPGRHHREIPFPQQLFDYIETKDIPKLGTRFRKLVQRLHFGSVSMRAMSAARFDAVFIFKPYDFINAWRWKSRRRELKVVMNYQGTDFFPTDRFWHRWIDREYAVSPENARLAESRYGGIVPVIPNGVDPLHFLPATDQVSAGLHLLTAGRLVGWKGLRVLAEAVAEVDGIHWHVAGDGPELLWLKTHAVEKKYESRVSWHGVLDAAELARLMQSCHYFAQPSIDFDACPTAVLQAMSSGLVVLMSDKVGLRESFIPDRDFLLVTGAKEKWIAALRRLKALAPDKRRALGSSAREAVIRSFSWSGICTQIEALLA
ncbi:MAG: glycosyltransferase family 4 protein [Methylacidiphilales bacterium]|nr:glycosyltransferase family 4 protein [Candidatus Methylacidiphilales bacterium]